MNPGSVYFIKVEGMDIFKIGYCETDLKKRIDLLKIGNPFRIAYYGIINNLDARGLEKRLHVQFRHYKMNGEWFSISEEQATDAIRINGGILVTGLYRKRKQRNNNRKMEEKPCPICGHMFAPSRTDADVCSAKCRTKKSRLLKEATT